MSAGSNIESNTHDLAVFSAEKTSALVPDRHTKAENTNCFTSLQTAFRFWHLACGIFALRRSELAIFLQPVR